MSFRALDEEIILRVVDSSCCSSRASFGEKKVEVTTDALRKHLAKRGFDLLMGGARPMQRLIQDTIRARWPTSCCSAAWSTAGA